MMKRKNYSDLLKISDVVSTLDIFVSIVIETSGNSYVNDKIISIGACSSNKTDETFYSLIKFGSQIKNNNKRILDLKKELCAAPIERMVMLRFWAWLQDVRLRRIDRIILIGTNIIPFDIPFIFMAFLRHEIEVPSNIFIIDLLPLFRTHCEKPYNLSIIFKKITHKMMGESHNTLNDAANILEIFEHVNFKTLAISYNYVQIVHLFHRWRARYICLVKQKYNHNGLKCDIDCKIHSKYFCSCR